MLSTPIRVKNSGWFLFEPKTQKLQTFGSYPNTNPWGVTFDDWGQHVASHPIYAQAFPPYTTSNVAGAMWHPVTLYEKDQVTPETMTMLHKVRDATSTMLPNEEKYNFMPPDLVNCNT